MAGAESVQPVPEINPPPPREYDQPWRSTPWGKREDLRKELRGFQLSNPNIKHVRILLASEGGAGKLSFINSINSAFQGRVTSDALVDDTSGTKTYYIRGKEHTDVLPFVFNDFMGLEDGESHCAHIEDVVKALRGLLTEGCKLNPTPVSAEDTAYRSDPAPQDQTYCLVYIIAAEKVSFMNPDHIKKMKSIRKSASGLDIPQVIIMTRVDEACPLVNKTLRKIYTSKKIKEKMQECSNVLGVPMNHIFPVKNYHEEIDTDNDTDVLILTALTQIVQTANDKLVRSLSCDVKNRVSGSKRLLVIKTTTTTSITIIEQHLLVTRGNKIE
ncbi:interferon-induced protein 44-like [Triplophysa dalaica]|uniref:interferon-induced protein 44-like n=1 Tax=Triplophysa dalaica TaxID=1582913 RepID=UPI0024DF96BB|nr:interferon-induced protein 44-like [Triplophysa dalaica]